MNTYAQKMVEMMNRTGQPMTTTTTVKQPNEGLDLSGLMMMLMLNSMFKDKASTSIGTTPAPSSGLDMRAIAGLAPSTMTSAIPSVETIGTTYAPPALDLQKLIQILASIQK
jgi:hypothetical protein